MQRLSSVQIGQWFRDGIQNAKVLDSYYNSAGQRVVIYRYEDSEIPHTIFAKGHHMVEVVDLGY